MRRPLALTKFASPLRYPGGKFKLARFVAAVLAANNCLDGNYVEPYAGGASVALSLLYLEYVSRVYLNDLNRQLYAFWEAVLNQPEALCKMVSDTKLSIDEWRRQRDTHLRPSSHSQLEIAFSTLFLNRTNRSGIIKTGGVIGGLRQKGSWRLDARFNRAAIIQRILMAARYSNRITIHNLDASAYLSTVVSKLPSKSFLYLDPPYYVKGSGLYEDHYGPTDHRQIAAKIQAYSTHKWMVSYDNAPEIRAVYRDRRSLTYGLSYSASKVYTGAENMYFCDEMALPNRKVIASLVPGFSMLRIPRRRNTRP
jgi:DNA adenine methylase